MSNIVQFGLQVISALCFPPKNLKTDVCVRLSVCVWLLLKRVSFSEEFGIKNSPPITVYYKKHNNVFHLTVV